MVGPQAGKFVHFLGLQCLAQTVACSAQCQPSKPLVVTHLEAQYRVLSGEAAARLLEFLTWADIMAPGQVCAPSLTHMLGSGGLLLLDQQQLKVGP